ncbi:hypothetical protein [Protofrankia sp. BMG5.30]|uniref:WXG100 family type VII secretion target n=2 Tax=Protofrankia coriariae TaxID=1562887 RepID=A0ABR5F6V4_9ACTN|nr:hypothetical protein [Protofrankia sp. BMG5.30]KLL12403.1 hypothetical protein FrCorBMG51_05235 [Protofrankia coriariae]ONH37273.1 hypothetical protein BL254_04260 [Protofrankia sp. BMG5.30]
MMASVFGCDPDVARQVSSDLADIRSTLASLGAAFDGLHGVTGSREVETALDHFVSHSSDSRELMDELLERASGLLRGLAEGVSEVDSALAGALEPASPEVPAAVVSASPVAAGGM